MKSEKFATATQFPAEKTSAEANSSLFTIHSSLQMDIHAALAILKEEERVCVTLQLIDGYPIDEIAKMMDMPANTVKSHLRRGKEKLTTYLKNNGYDGNR